MGFIAARRTISSPLDIPPSIPPALFVARRLFMLDGETESRAMRKIDDLKKQGDTAGVGRHILFPVFVIGVHNTETQRTAERKTVPYPTQNFNSVALYFNLAGVCGNGFSVYKRRDRLRIEIYLRKLQNCRRLFRFYCGFSSKSLYSPFSLVMTDGDNNEKK